VTAPSASILSDFDTSMITATITRERWYKRLPSPGPAWKWIYSVHGCGVVLAGFDHISEARLAAKRHGATAIIQTWA